MIRTKGHKVFRDIWARKARTALVAISIFIGVFGTITLFSMGDLSVRQMKKDLDQNKMAMVRSYLNVPPGAEPDNEQILTQLRALPGVTVVEGQMAYPIFWKKVGAAEFNSSFVISNSQPLDQIQLEPMRLMKGRFPDPGKKEILIERRFATEHGLGVGDQMVVRVLSQMEQNGGVAPEETWTIVGTAFFPYGYSGAGTIFPENMLFAQLGDAEYITGFARFTSFYARYIDYPTAEKSIGALTQAIADTGAYIPVLTLKDNPAKSTMISFLNTAANVMAILGLMALIVSGFLVFNVLNAIVTEQRRQIGVMKSLGASRTDNFIVYSGMALVYGLIGVIPAVILGIPVGFMAAKGFAQSVNMVLDNFGVSVRAILMGGVVGLLIPVLASILPVFSGTRVSIREALSDFGISTSYGQGRLARLVQRLPIPLNVRQGISNVLRQKGRIVLTVVTLTLAAGAFMGVFAVFTSVSKVLDEFFGAYQYHFAVGVADAKTLDQAQTLVAEQFPNLRSKGPYLSLAAEIDGFDKVFTGMSGPPALFATGYDPSTGAFHLKMVEGQTLSENPEGVIVSRSVAKWIHKGVGDTITIHAGGHTGQYPIIGITSFPYDGVWFEWSHLAQLIGNVSSDGSPLPSGWMMSMKQADPSASSVDDTTKKINDVMMSNGLAATFENVQLFKETLTTTVATFQAMFNISALLIALVGAVGLLTTLSMSVYERQKEIGVMRSIGAGSTAIVGQFMTEGVVVGLLAWVLGLPLSYLVDSGLIAALDLGAEYKGYPIEAALLGLVGTLAITALASMWPSINAARKTVSDILRYQ